MPWWAYTYLAIFIMLSIGGIYDDLKRNHRTIHVAGGLVSAVFVVIFVTGYFYHNLGNSLGIYAFLMLVVGVLFELYSAKRDLAVESANHEMINAQNQHLNNYALVVGDLIIVPGYMFGFMVGLRNVGL